MKDSWELSILFQPITLIMKDLWKLSSLHKISALKEPTWSILTMKDLFKLLDFLNKLLNLNNQLNKALITKDFWRHSIFKIILITKNLSQHSDSVKMFKKISIMMDFYQLLVWSKLKTNLLIMRNSYKSFLVRRKEIIWEKILVELYVLLICQRSEISKSK